MPVQKFSISLHPDVSALVDRRRSSGALESDRSSVINKSLNRYFAVLDESRRHLTETLTDAEVGLILDVLNGTLFAEPFSVQLVGREIEDSLSDGYADKWKCDGPELVHKLNALSYAEQMALVDAVERWWNRVAAGENKLKPSEALKK